MKVLFVTEQFPFPLHDGGNLRTYHVLSGLAQRHEVCLLSHPPQDRDAGRRALAGMAEVVMANKPPRSRRLLSNGLRYGTRSYPFFVLKNWSSSLLARADELLSSQSFDAIHFNHLDTACFTLHRDWPQWKVFDSHNCLTELAQQVCRENSSWLRRLLYARESRCLAQMEQMVARRMNVTLACSQDDVQAFRQLGHVGSMMVAPNGVDTNYFRQTSTDAEQPGGLVFTGAMNYYPNEQAALSFCQKVMPGLKETTPGAHLTLVGSSPTKRVQQLHDGDSVIVTGRVEDVRPYVHRAQVVVVPLDHGSGTRLKILEAFAMSKAVVSTTRGAEGIPAVDGREILIADDSQSFVEQVQRLLRSAPLRQRIGRAARQFVESQYDWRHVNEQILGAYEKLPGEAIADVA